MDEPNYDDLVSGRGDFLYPRGVLGVLEAVKAEAEADPDDLDLADRVESVQALVDAFNGTVLGARHLSENSLTMVGDDYWEEFCQDEVEEQHDIREASLLWSHINWKALADEMQSDHVRVEVEHGEFAGVWWVRG